MKIFNKRSIIIFETLSFVSFVPALFLDVLGFNVFYSVITPKLRDCRALAFLSKSKIKMLNYEKADAELIKQFLLRGSECPNLIRGKVFFSQDFLKVFTQLFENCHKIDKRLNIVFNELIHKEIEHQVKISQWAQYFKRCGFKRIFVILNANRFNTLLKQMSTFRLENIKFLSLPSFDVISKICRLLIIIFKKSCALLKSQLYHRRKNKILPSKNDEYKNNNRSYYDYRVLFFPNKGISYGKLFQKDYFYSDNENSNLHSNNILHIEFSSPNALPLDFTYNNQKVPLCYFNQIIQRSLLFSLKKFITWLISANNGFRPISVLFFRNGFLSLSLAFQIFSTYQTYLLTFKKFKKISIAIMGYDVTFPKTLTLAFSTLNVPTVAVQERCIHAFYSNLYVICDYYFVGSKFSAELINRNNNFSIGMIKPIGIVRLDLLHSFLKTKFTKKTTTSHKTLQNCLVLDVPSQHDVYTNNKQILNNWKNNLAFYKDIIKLAKLHTKINFTIRGRDSLWLELDFFQNLVQDINQLPNLTVNTDYSKFNISYTLAAQSDCIIAKHTSLVDEALAAGIPTIIYDYLPESSLIYPSIIFDYKNLPIIASSYKNLCNIFEQIMCERLDLQTPIYKISLEKYYDNFFDGKIRERLLCELSRIMEG